MKEVLASSWSSKTMKTSTAQSYLVAGIFAVFATLLAPGCRPSEPDSAATENEVRGRVTDGNGVAVVGARVYLIPTSAVNTTPITAQGVLDGTTEAFDEPLEDAVANAGDTFKSATTDGNGDYTIEVDTTEAADYYFFVQPSASDTMHLPGGDKSRVAMSSLGFEMDVNIKLSTTPSASATYIGTTACLECHEDYSGQLYTAHKLAIADPVTGASPLQKRDNFPHFLDGTDRFPSATAYTNGLRLYVGDYDGTRGFDKFTVYETASKVTTLYASMYLWKDTADGEYKVTIVNELNSADPNNAVTLPVALTYGGTVYKVRLLVRIPSSLATPTRVGMYPLLQFQSFPGISVGSEFNYDRSRSVYRDYHFDWYWDDGADETFGTADDLIKAPSTSKTFGGTCAGCHLPGITLSQNATTNEWLADSVNDAGGATDIDGDGMADEVNVGCESCHGPGSEHEDADDYSAIVTIGALSPSRENMICGTCHDRGAGQPNGYGTDPLWDDAGLLPRPGDSRAHVLAEHMGRKGPALSAFHADKLHSKSHHQQYSDLIKSKHYRNERILVVCSDCHDSHAYRTREGLTEYPHNLMGEPADPSSELCGACHGTDPIAHMTERTGATHAGLQTQCSDCHMPRTAQTGAGVLGFLLGTPTGTSTDADIVYWNNDISSHLFDFVTKTWRGVSGVVPGKAMPAPYTNRCGTCHDPSALQYNQPDSP